MPSVCTPDVFPGCSKNSLYDVIYFNLATITMGYYRVVIVNKEVRCCKDTLQSPSITIAENTYCSPDGHFVCVVIKATDETEACSLARIKAIELISLL